MAFHISSLRYPTVPIFLRKYSYHILSYHLHPFSLEFYKNKPADSTRAPLFFVPPGFSPTEWSSLNVPPRPCRSWRRPKRSSRGCGATCRRRSFVAGVRFGGNGNPTRSFFNSSFNIIFIIFLFCLCFFLVQFFFRFQGPCVFVFKELKLSLLLSFL